MASKLRILVVGNGATDFSSLCDHIQRATKDLQFRLDRVQSMAVARRFCKRSKYDLGLLDSGIDPQPGTRAERDGILGPFVFNIIPAGERAAMHSVAGDRPEPQLVIKAQPSAMAIGAAVRYARELREAAESERRRRGIQLGQED